MNTNGIPVSNAIAAQLLHAEVCWLKTALAIRRALNQKPRQLETDAAPDGATPVRQSSQAIDAMRAGD